MGLITPGLVISVFLIILIVCILLANLVKANKHRQSQLGLFLLALSGLSVIITLLFYYSVIDLQQQQGIIATIQETQSINTQILNNVYNTFVASSAVIPNFVSLLNPLTPCNQSAPPDTDSYQACLERSTLSHRIFVTWQDVMTSSTYIRYEWIPILSGFLQWANSPQLFIYWNLLYIDFTENAQAFGNLLFEYGLPITEQVPISYSEAAEKMFNDPRFRAIAGRI